MPLAYGGGVKSVEQVERIVSLGVEKVVIGSAAIADPNLMSRAACKVGSGNIVIVADVRLDDKGNYQTFTHNGDENHSDSRRTCLHG